MKVMIETSSHGYLQGLPNSRLSHIPLACQTYEYLICHLSPKLNACLPNSRIQYIRLPAKLKLTNISYTASLPNSRIQHIRLPTYQTHDQIMHRLPTKPMIVSYAPYPQTPDTPTYQTPEYITQACLPAESPFLLRITRENQHRYHLVNRHG